MLLKRKTSKKHSPYNPDPFKVTKIWGTQIQGERHGEKKIRDSQRWKKIKVSTRPQRKQHRHLVHDADVGAREPEGHQARHNAGYPEIQIPDQDPPLSEEEAPTPGDNETIPEQEEQDQT